MKPTNEKKKSMTLVGKHTIRQTVLQLSETLKSNEI